MAHHAELLDDLALEPDADLAVVRDKGTPIAVAAAQRVTALPPGEDQHHAETT
jgi:hypothetical protein